METSDIQTADIAIVTPRGAAKERLDRHGTSLVDRLPPVDHRHPTHGAKGIESANRFAALASPAEAKSAAASPAQPAGANDARSDFVEPSAKVAADRAASRALTAERCARLSLLKVTELKTLCRSFNLTVSGKKEDLQDRIAASRSRACDNYFANESARQPRVADRLPPARPSHQRSASAARPSPGKTARPKPGQATEPTSRGSGVGRALPTAAVIRSEASGSASEGKEEEEEEEDGDQDEGGGGGYSSDGGGKRKRSY
jgi:hypothetical protein